MRTSIPSDVYGRDMVLHAPFFDFEKYHGHMVKLLKIKIRVSFMELKIRSQFFNS